MTAAQSGTRTLVAVSSADAHGDTAGCGHAWVGGWSINGWMDGWTDGWRSGQMDGWVHPCTAHGSVPTQHSQSLAIAAFVQLPETHSVSTMVLDATAG
eukprot:366511-Chlamydomonas_euryale.AAC.3